jgi:hypothetical protein
MGLHPFEKAPMHNMQHACGNFLAFYVCHENWHKGSMETQHLPHKTEMSAISVSVAD